VISTPAPDLDHAPDQSRETSNVQHPTSNVQLRNKDEMFRAGVALAEEFCDLNGVPMPSIERLNPAQRNYHIGTCAYYRPTTIHIMVEKCANKGFGGRAWSWPGYKVDRTPYGVIQHELGHHVDNFKFVAPNEVFSKCIYEASKEPPLTGYLGTDSNSLTFYMEWFAENFRLFVTNPDLSLSLRPRFYEAFKRAGFKPVKYNDWESVLFDLDAPARIRDQARKQIKTSSSVSSVTSV
jgi:hypothetical protein